MTDDTCWSVSCPNYGQANFWCDCNPDEPEPRYGSEGECYR